MEAQSGDVRRETGWICSAAWPIFVFLVARVFLSALGGVLFLLGVVPLTADPVLRPYFGLAPVTEGWPGALLGVWLRFDAVHYLRIASQGYSAVDLSVYFPLYPLLVRAAGMVLGKDYLLGGILVSNLAAVAALILFDRLLEDEFRDNGLARRACVFLMAFPTAFFLLAPYPESLALLCSLLAFRQVRRDRWLLAGAVGLASALTRPQGAVMSLVMVVEVARQWRRGRRPSPAALLASTLPLLGLAGFLSYRAWVGLPPLNAVLSLYWAREAAVPFAAVFSTLQRIASGTASAIEFVDLAAVILMTVIGVVVVRRLHPLYAIYHWSVLLLNLSQFRLPQPISSQARYALALFPAFIALGQMGSSARRYRLMLYPSIALWALLAGEFLVWGWVG
ncbi:MAG: hypothetical protein AB1449_00135 [Chloroflexota bacterium]